MRIVCFITVYVYLSSTVSTDEIKFINRIKKIRPQEELISKDVSAREEMDLTTGTYSSVHSTLPKSRPKARIETFPKREMKPKRIREVQFGSQQYRHYNRDRSTHFLKRLKTRSVSRTSYELENNQLNELTKSISEAHNKKPIRIEPVFRVTTRKKNVFESIVDIVRQLLNPPKDELGPVVGPIQVPGSERKIYLRLLEPVEESQVTVRFVTQVQVPVIDAEKGTPHRQAPPLVDPISVLLNGQRGIYSTDAIFDATNRHSVRSNNRKGGGQVKKLPTLNSPTSSPKDVLQEILGEAVANSQDDASSDKGVVLSEIESDKDPSTDAQFNFGSQENSENPSIDKSGGNNAEYQVTEILNDTVRNEDPTELPESWYQLDTHHLPLRQIASLTSNSEQTGPASCGNSYTAQSEAPLADPNTHSNSYEPYNRNDSVPKFYASSYDQHYGAPNLYSISYSTQDGVNNNPNNYSISYQNPNNEFNAGDGISHTTPYQRDQNALYNTSNFHSTFDGRQYVDLYNSPSSYSTSYDKPGNASSSPSSSSPYAISYGRTQEIRAAPNSNDALRVVDPPYFFGRWKAPGNHTDGTLQLSTQRPQLHGYDSYDFKEPGSNHRTRTDDRTRTTTWSTREKTEWTGVEKPGDSSETADGSNRDKWQPVFVRGSEDWQENAFADLRKVTTDQSATKRPYDRTRTASRNATNSNDWSGVRQNNRQNNKRRGAQTADVITGSRCRTLDKENGCKHMRSTNISESTKIVRKRTHSGESVNPIASRSNANETIESSRFDAKIAKNSTTSTTTERPLASTRKIPTAKNPTSSIATERLIANKTASRQVEKSTADRRSTTEKAPVLNDSARKTELPKRPMVMKKPTFLMKRMELSSTTTKRTTGSGSTTQKSVISSTTKRSMTTRKSTFRSTTSKSTKTKSSTT